MTYRWLNGMLSGLALTFVFIAPTASAQSSKPQNYTLTVVSNVTEASMFTGFPSTLKIYRAGSKELVDLTIPPSPPGHPDYKGIHMTYLFDFAAHKAYTRVVNYQGCSWMKYVSAGAPTNYDPIGASQQTQDELSKTKAKMLGPDTVNGIPAKVFEGVADSSEPGAKPTTYKVWLATTGNYLLKQDAPGLDGKVLTWLEVKQLSFDTPPSSLLATPEGCTETQGEWSDSGVSGHAETTVETSAAGESSGSKAGATKAGAKVTAVQLQQVHDYTGPCPTRIRMVGTITTDGPGTVWYQFAAGESEPGETVTFSAAGTKTVTHVMTFNVDPKFGTTMGVGALLQAIMEDQQGNYESRSKGSNNAGFTINCAPATSASAPQILTFGDRDLLGFGYPSGADPTKGAKLVGLAPDAVTLAPQPFNHGFPFNSGDNDAQGHAEYPNTDQIFVGSNQTGEHDGYAGFENRKKGPATFRLDYSSIAPAGAKIASLTLGVAADDFQFPTFGQPFRASINGRPNRTLTNTLNKLDETGPLTQFLTLGIDPAILTPDNVLVLQIDEGGDGGDGFAIDFLTIGITTAP